MKSWLHASSRPDPPPVLAVGLLSAASLSLELLLLRWFAILYWHHLAHMIISVALLGLGIAGSILTVSQHKILKRFEGAFQAAACGFALSLPTVIWLIRRLEFNPLELVWDPGQSWRLALLFLVSAIPFVFSGFAIGLALRRYPQRIAGLYRADLLGAAAGAAVTAALLTVLSPQALLRTLAVPALLAAIAAHPWRQCAGIRRGLSLVAPLAAGLILAAWPSDLLEPYMSPYKALPQARRVPGRSIVSRRVSPAGNAVALESRAVPFRHAPGLSMLSPAEPPAQLALFIDGHAAGAIDGGAPPPGGNDADYLAWTTAHLAHILAPPRPRVLILGSGGGTDARHARLAGAEHVTAVETSGALLRVARDARALVASAREAEGIVPIQAEPRAFLTANRERYDLIQISLFGTEAPYADAAQAMRENYLYTVEGVRLMLQTLSESGVLAVTMPIAVPPRAPVKLLATMAKAAEAEGWQRTGDRLAALRSWNTVTLAFTKHPLDVSQVNMIRDFCRQRAFDPVWFPGIRTEDINRFNVLDHPYFYEAAQAILLGDRAGYLDGYPFYVHPATDDRPYFGRFFRWRTFPQWWAGRASGTAPFLEWSYLLAWMLVGAALLLSVPLVGLPLRPLIRSVTAGERRPARHLARGIYFSALGLAFLMLEIAFIRKFVLFLGHPVAAMAVVVPSFLAFAGCGSGWSERFRTKAERNATRRRPRPVTKAVVGIILATALVLTVSPSLFNLAAGWPLAPRVMITVALIGGMAFWMGMPFPLGLHRLGATAPAWIPLAWGVNGLTSVISAVGAGLLAMHAGFRTVTLTALLLYLAAAMLEERL